MKTTTAQMALEALKGSESELRDHWYDHPIRRANQAAITALEADLAQPVEPVARAFVDQLRPDEYRPRVLVEWMVTATPGLLYAAPQEAAAPGMDDTNIANRLDRWFIEGLHAADLDQYPYEEDTISRKWWMRGCNHAILLERAPAAPDGWKLVLTEPTEEMIDEGARGWEVDGGLYEAYANVYRYMVAASPAAPGAAS